MLRFTSEQGLSDDERRETGRSFASLIFARLRPTNDVNNDVQEGDLQQLWEVRVKRL